MSERVQLKFVPSLLGTVSNMKKAGKIIAAIFASICIVVSLITAGVGWAGKFAQDNPDLIQEGLETAAETDASLSEEQKQMQEDAMQDIQTSLEMIGDVDFDFGHMTRQGLVGALLSVIVLVTVLINVPNMPFITPAIASVGALGGAIFCGWLIAVFLVPALIGSVLVLVANLTKEEEPSAEATE